jgi:hypothetical protein
MLKRADLRLWFDIAQQQAIQHRFTLGKREFTSTEIAGVTIMLNCKVALLSALVLAPFSAHATDLGFYRHASANTVQTREVITERRTVTTERKIVRPVVRQIVVHRPIIHRTVVPRVVVQREAPVFVEREIRPAPIFVERRVRPVVVEEEYGLRYNQPRVYEHAHAPFRRWEHGGYGQRWAGGYGRWAGGPGRRFGGFRDHEAW